VLLAATPARKARKESTDKLIGKKKGSGPQAVERAAEIFFQDQPKPAAKAAARHNPHAAFNRHQQQQFRRGAYGMYVDESDEGEYDSDFQHMEEEEDDDDVVPYPLHALEAGAACAAAGAGAAAGAFALPAPFRVERGPDGSEVVVVD